MTLSESMKQSILEDLNKCDKLFELVETKIQGMKKHVEELRTTLNS